MLSPFLRSLTYAAEGLWHALQTERNLRVFAAGVILSLLLALFFHLDTLDWIIVLLTGGTFLSVELINTSMERMSSAFYRHIEEAKDTHKHRHAMKATKDVAAGASLIVGVAWAAVMIIVFWPYIFQFLIHSR